MPRRARPVLLARPASLPRRADFLRAAREGLRVASPGMVVQLVERGDGAPARVGITATKKLGNAVARNRIRRRLREAARLVLGAAPCPGADIVLVGRAGTRGRDFAQLCGEFERALRRHAGAAR